MNTQAYDNYNRYFAEKMWDMIPAGYRHEDGIADNPGVLRALVEVIAEHIAVVRRSQDRLWEDQFIESCDDWAVPYIAQLVGARLVSVLNSRARRVDVAKTIYYRRRKGTLGVLEELISDITGWDGVAVENFRRLAKVRHRLDPHAKLLAGKVTNTQPGGWADIRKIRSSKLLGSPFDEFHYTPDVRQHCGNNGRYGIPKLAFYLYRIPSLLISGVTPYRIASTHNYTFDPSGRDIRLFAPRSRLSNEFDWSNWQSLEEWELPGRISCRVLNDTKGKDALVPNAINILFSSDLDLTAEHMVAADLSNWLTGSLNVDVVIDPMKGRFSFSNITPTDPTTTNYHYGFSGDIGAGTYNRNHVEDLIPTAFVVGGGLVDASNLIDEGVIQISDNATYEIVDSPPDPIIKLVVQAANQCRPYVKLSQPWILTAASASSSSIQEDAKLSIDGIWFGGEDIVLQGNYEEVTIQYSTLDPGGSTSDGEIIKPVTLKVEGFVERLVIKHSIVSSISVQGESSTVQEILIEDSILQNLTAPLSAENIQEDVITLPNSHLHMYRSTVFGNIRVKVLTVSESIITGELSIRNIQQGCFRFSAAQEKYFDMSEDGYQYWLPKPYKSVPLPDSGSYHYFASQRFGDSHYAQFSGIAPIELKTGAENGSEIGAFSKLMTPIKQESLNTKVTEYMPFGLIPIYINET